MQYSRAFAKLGYKLEVPRQDWSAMNDRGVCISIWQKEIHTRDRMYTMDSRVDAGPHEKWGNAIGNIKRKGHLQIAMDKYAGRVDVVIVNGVPGEGFGDAHPWIVAERKGAIWYLTHLDPETGHFAVGVKATK